MREAEGDIDDDELWGVDAAVQSRRAPVWRTSIHIVNVIFEATKRRHGAYRQFNNNDGRKSTINCSASRCFAPLILEAALNSTKVLLHSTTRLYFWANGPLATGPKPRKNSARIFEKRSVLVLKVLRTSRVAVMTGHSPREWLE